MAKAIKFTVIVFCMICILAICIAPLADLPATSLRSYQAAMVLLWSLIATAFSLILSTLKPLACIDLTKSEPVYRNTRCTDIPLSMKSSPILRC
jgi:hypothetical protein